MAGRGQRNVSFTKNETSAKRPRALQRTYAFGPLKQIFRRIKFVAHVAQRVVFGAGVLELTVAIAARLVGHSVRIFAQKRISDAASQRDPLFASAYPAASMIPHSVPSDQLKGLVQESDVVFEALSKQTPKTGVRLQKHYEIIEGPPKLPPYREALRAFSLHGAGSPDIPIARRGAEIVSGISFDCFFCNMPVYGPWLEEVVLQLGIPQEVRRVERSWIASLDADLICQLSRSWS
jgi:hypothetical protein